MSSTATPADVLAGNARWCVAEGDAAEVLRTLPDGCAHAIVTDPPSGIAFMGAEWDRDKGGRAQWVAWLAGILADARRCTRDGGRSVVWSLPRTSHWTGCAVEDAGWLVETTITHLYGTGWPKGSSQLKPAAETWWLARTGKSTDLNVEACRVVGAGASPSVERRASAARSGRGAAGVRPGGIVDGSSLEAYTAEREGESVGRYPPNVVLSHSSGCERVGTRKVQSNSANAGRGAGGIGATSLGAQTGNTGYADADGFESVEAWTCCEGCPVAELDAQSGSLTSGTNCFVRESAKGRGNTYGARSLEAGTECITYGDTGGASRFFPCFPADPAVFRYVAKPSSSEKGEGAETNAHPTVKSIALMRWLIDLVTQRDDLVVDPFGGSGTTGAAALASGRRVILVERDPHFAEIARQRCAHWGAEWEAPARASKRKTPRVADAGPQGDLFAARTEPAK